jgi:phosphoribosylformimino-5-aminoimidazole carboxamide ribotide isomerase
MMDLLPAIDLRGGGAVRLVQGDFDREQSYGDPLELAHQFVDAGATALHVVDLDAARSGTPVNRQLIMTMAHAVGVPVQTGGGIRTDHDVDELLGAGLARVILGTAALEDIELLRRCATRWPDQVVLGLDYRRGPDGSLEAAVRGWLEGSGRTVTNILDELVDLPLGAVVVTAIERDGTLEGPDLEGLEAVTKATSIPVVASGGVGQVDDLVALRALPLDGVVVGKALVDGRISMKEALEACAASA